MQSNTFLAAHHFFLHNFLILQKQVSKKFRDNLGLSCREQLLKQAVYNSSYFVVTVNHTWPYVPYALGGINSIA